MNDESIQNKNVMSPETDRYNSKKGIMKNFHNVNKLKESLKLNKDDVLGLFEESTLNYLNNNPKLVPDYDAIINENITYTKEEDQINFWNKLKGIIATLKKTKNKYPLPELKFGKSLGDLEFIELLTKTINYACYSRTEDELKELKEKLTSIENITDNIFTFPKILKDIKEDALLAYILAEGDTEKKNSLDLLKTTTCSLVPLIQLPFTKENKNYDLNKEELNNILTSNILLHYFKNNLDKFIPELNKKIQKNDDLKKYINLYLNNYNIYFCDLPESIYAITIHTGNIYVHSKYLVEYYENKMFNIINSDENIIIREKIILNIIHEINHGLLRLIDDDKNKNFFLKSKNADSKLEILIFKDKIDETITFNFSGNESGNSFDYDFYKGYLFDNLFKHEANFFAEIKNIRDEKEYDLEFEKMITETKSKNPSETLINKFKKKFVFPRCFKSKLFGITIKDE